MSVERSRQRPPPPSDAEQRELLEAIYRRFHYDFRAYAASSMKRRLEKALQALECESYGELQRRLDDEPATFAELLQFLTVQVSDMFRDPPFFRIFRQRIVPELRTYPSLRFWVAGCATGEEAYSLAIILREEGLLDRSILYATDINPRALAKAEAGVYPLDRLATFSENHLDAGGKRPFSDYYTAGYGAAVLDRTLRKNIVFSDHSLATDNVFAEVQVVTCRNVLIYFDRALQDRALGLFRDALVRRGFLGIGTRETVQFSEHASSFQELYRDERWYQR